VEDEIKKQALRYFLWVKAKSLSYPLTK